MATVFLSYRHENDAQRDRVCALGEQLRREGIEVVLDQFFFEGHPGGPDEGWPAWSKRQAETEKVLIIASAGWFRCYEGTEVPGSGLGAAAEARVITQRLYNVAGVNPFARIVAFDPADALGIPLDLQGYHRFDPSRDLAAMIAWITGTATAVPPPVIVEWPAAPPVFKWEPADCEPVHDAFTLLLTAGTLYRVLLVRGASETGKSLLTRHLLGLALRCDWLACGRLDLKSGADLEGEFARFVAYLGVDDAVKATAGQPLRARLDALLAGLRARGRPTLLFFDTFEQGGDLARWVEDSALLAVPRAPWLRLLVAGQQVPNPAAAAWATFAAPILQLQQLDWEDWYRYGRRYHPDLTEQLAQQLYKLVGGKHSQLGQVLGPAA